MDYGLKEVNRKVCPLPTITGPVGRGGHKVDHSGWSGPRELYSIFDEYPMKFLSGLTRGSFLSLIIKFNPIVTGITDRLDLSYSLPPQDREGIAEMMEDIGRISAQDTQPSVLLECLFPDPLPQGAALVLSIGFKPEETEVVAPLPILDLSLD